MGKIGSFRELRVYQELARLHLAVHAESLKFPKFEMYELGSQIRRSTNAAPAILAEGWGSRHTNIYLESINRSKGEIRESQHHLDMAKAKGYLTPERWGELDGAYEACDRMLECLHQRLSEWRNSTRTGTDVHETSSAYFTHPHPDDWSSIVSLTSEVLSPPQCGRSPQPSPQPSPRGRGGK